MTINVQIEGSADPVETIRKIHVTTPRDEALRDRLDGLLKRAADGTLLPAPKHFTTTCETRGVMLVSKSGAGKTTMLRKALARHPALQPENDQTMPWIEVRCSSPATTKGVGIDILRKTGYPEVARGTVERDIWRLVRHRLGQLKTVVLWIDEAQDLFRTKTSIEIRSTLNMIKGLMQGEGSVIVILSGVEELLKLASTDHQITRRMRTHLLRDVTEACEGGRLWTVLETYAQKVGLEPPARDDLIGRLIHANHGRFGLCIEMIIAAIEFALEQGCDALHMEHFAEVFADCTDCDDRANVFRTKRWSQVDINAPALL